MKCPNCNNEIADNTKFCPECGANITSPQTTTPQQTQPVYNQTNSVNNQASFTPPKKKMSLPLKIVIGVVGCIIIFAILGSCSDSDTTTTTTTNVSTNSGENTTPATSDTSASSSSSTDVTKPINIYKYLSKNYEGMNFTISDKAKAFLTEHPNLFPAKAYIDCQDYITWSVEYKHLAKNAANYGDKLIEIYGTISQIWELSTDVTGLNDTVSVINMSDYNGDRFFVFYYGSLDIYEGDNITMTGLPLDMGSYTNTIGGSTNCAVIAGTYIQKESY
ncbi:MAG: zinc-ribbon domain-containing protein [Lachnospirales bacterium]